MAPIVCEVYSSGYPLQGIRVRLQPINCPVEYSSATSSLGLISTWNPGNILLDSVKFPRLRLIFSTKTIPGIADEVQTDVDLEGRSVRVLLWVNSPVCEIRLPPYPSQPLQPLPPPRPPPPPSGWSNNQHLLPGWNDGRRHRPVLPPIELPCLEKGRQLPPIIPPTEAQPFVQRPELAPVEANSGKKKRRRSTSSSSVWPYKRIVAFKMEASVCKVLVEWAPMWIPEDLVQWLDDKSRTSFQLARTNLRRREPTGSKWEVLRDISSPIPWNCQFNEMRFVDDVIQGLAEWEVKQSWTPLHDFIAFQDDEGVKVLKKALEEVNFSKLVENGTFYLLAERDV